MKHKLPAEVAAAARTAQEKQAVDMVLLDLTGRSSFTDYFLISTVRNPRQGQAVSDEIQLQLAHQGLRPTHIEGYQQAEWILMDYAYFVVHIFSQKARVYYDLERLWRSAPRIPVEEAG